MSSDLITSSINAYSHQADCLFSSPGYRMPETPKTIAQTKPSIYLLVG